MQIPDSKNPNKAHTVSSDDSVEILRVERELLMQEAHRLEEQLKQTQDEIISLERSYAGRVRNAYLRFLSWLFPIGSKRFWLGRRIWRVVQHWDGRLGWIGTRWRQIGNNRRWIPSEGLTLSEAVYQDALEKRQPINMEYRRFIHLIEPQGADLIRQIKESGSWADPPKLSIVTALHTNDLDQVQTLAESIQLQTYITWQWWVIVPSSVADEVHTYLREVAKKDRRIIIRQGQSSTHVVTNINQGVTMAGGEYIVLLNHADSLSPHGLYSIAKTIEELQHPEIIYTDHDYLGHHGSRVDPVFKPDWSPEMMMSTNLLDSLTVIRKDVIEAIGGLNEDVGEAYLWDFSMRISEFAEKPIHIPMILSHRQFTRDLTKTEMASRMLRTDSERAAVLNHLRRGGLRLPKVELTPVWRMKVTWELKDSPLVSIIIPSKDQPELLHRCVDSIQSKTDYGKYEIIIVDTGSEDAETSRLYETYRALENLQVLDCEGAFNFSRAINLGAEAARGEVLLFLNNDTEVLEPDWLRPMLQWFEMDGIGVVGGKLLYQDGRIQHGGVIVGMGGIAAHLFMEEDENVNSMFGSDQWYRNLWAVTAACMLVPREVYDEVGGFDEGYTINYSDVDFCLKVVRSGRRILYTPDTRLLHHEGITHGKKIPRSDFERAAERWSDWGMFTGDPYYNPNLSYMSASPKFVFSKHDRPEDLLRNLMARLPDKEILELPEDLDR